MPRDSKAFRPKRGQTVYRVEWKKDVPVLASYTVESAALSSIAVRDAKGKEHLFMNNLDRVEFANSPDDAVCIDFMRVALQVTKQKLEPKKGLATIGKLASLLK